MTLARGGSPLSTGPATEGETAPRTPPAFAGSAAAQSVRRLAYQQA